MLPDILEGGGGGAPTPTVTDAPSNRKKITCEFCESELGPSGEYKKLSDKAKKMRDAEETIDANEKLIGELRAENADLKAKLAAQNSPTPGSPAKRKGICL